MARQGTSGHPWAASESWGAHWRREAPLGLGRAPQSPSLSAPSFLSANPEFEAGEGTPSSHTHLLRVLYWENCKILPDHRAVTLQSSKTLDPLKA